MSWAVLQAITVRRFRRCPRRGQRRRRFGTHPGYSAHWTHLRTGFSDDGAPYTEVAVYRAGVSLVQTGTRHTASADTPGTATASNRGVAGDLLRPSAPCPAATATAPRLSGGPSEPDSGPPPLFLCLFHVTDSPAKASTAQQSPPNTAGRAPDLARGFMLLAIAFAHAAPADNPVRPGHGLAERGRRGASLQHQGRHPRAA